MTTKVHLIKAVMNFRTQTPDVVFTTANGALTGVYNNPGFAGAPAQPVDQPTLQAANNTLAAANSAAANGGKKELEQQKKDKEVVVKFLVQLAHWAEANCKDDMTTFLSSGFHAVSTARTTTPPVSEFWGQTPNCHPKLQNLFIRVALHKKCPFAGSRL